MIYRDAGALLERIAALENRYAAVRDRAARLAQRRWKKRLVRLAMAAVGIALFALGTFAYLYATSCWGALVCCPSRKGQAMSDMRTVHPIAEKWLVDHPGHCPTLQQLLREKELSPASRVEDPWGHGFEIICDSDEIYVASSGPDGKVGTADDFRIPTPPPLP